MTTLAEKKKADADGHAAGVAGKKMSANPHDEDHELHWFWLRGWVGAGLEKHCSPRVTDGAVSDLIRERDNAEEWADNLAAEVVELTGYDIGEHSNLTNPWEEALDAIREYRQNAEP